ncbi:LON peptidase substrate-binding domain-containing protein [Microbacterium sp. zg.Y1090]|uniref:LON peptidase substrate-binding domain-containing protein n=1 Tax=Microbacterium TaxID=33882 RepID=UPI00214AEE5F|nr:MULTISPECIES: LON peptidase substrate-binding domain-containing protein [unclassified Microbacterium]MCR2812724.1 LON peptidase substrate-binding domain-containing protein [Microbacterium sp. zg.Y1084]MCR2817482.1 LON peptidase substrate-binding domain-containing protein [Microbacterium sp. zg.Y1090]MDL5485876.1 LON peptidase substrate-binding domain-containing protein [Microbacterium sp. zg-Y1211]WIM29034.1 LON peptidase substrate-binding domain-containing protein [Microbacterium sp. zg-Y10
MTGMPMFPLGSVLLPYTPLPLRIFEPRYLTLIGRLLDEEDPQFGVVLIERGPEAGGGDQRSDIGTLARLVRVAPTATDLQVVAIGAERIRVERWLPDDPYPVADVSEVPPLEWSDALTPLRDEAEHIVRRVLARAADDENVRWDAETELSPDPVESSWQLAAIAPLGELDRFTLLQATTLGGLLRQIIDLTLDIEPLLTRPPADDIG